jgi:MFS transporter, DHA2 family, multidrug resistance protein
MTLKHLPNEEMGNATSLHSLMRNLGGSMGIALATTTLVRSTQTHQAYLGSHITVFDRSYQWAMEMLPPNAQIKAMGQPLIYEQLLRQANVLAFNDTFLF